MPPAVARERGCEVAYLPGLTMRRIADPYPGEAKTTPDDHAVAVPVQRRVSSRTGQPSPSLRRRILRRR